MSVILGAGDFVIASRKAGASLPDGWSFHEVGAVGVDRNDNVYVFNRGEHPMIVFDRDGNFLRSWGEGMFPRAHGVHMAPDDTIFCTDDGAHCVRKCTLDGKVLMTIGTPGKPAPFMSGQPFCRCTHTALSPKGEIYVTDGYGNAQVHKYTPDGKYLILVGQVRHRRGRVQPAAQRPLRCRRLGLCRRPREPPRAGVRRQRQVRDGMEQRRAPPERAAHDDGQVSAVLHRRGRSRIWAPIAASPIWDRASASCPTTGKLLARLGSEANPHGQAPGQFMSPHGIAVNSHGDIYVGEVSVASWPSLFPGQPRPANLRSLQKLVKVE